MKQVLSGLVYVKSESWLDDFQDEVGLVVMYCYRVLRDCDQDFKKLLLNIVEYYKGNYSDCNFFFRCKLDKNYEFLELCWFIKFLRNYYVMLLLV